MSGEPQEAHYRGAHGGWSAVGWSEDDPTPEEAMAALASMSRAGYPAAVAGLREAAERQRGLTGTHRGRRGTVVYSEEEIHRVVHAANAEIKALHGEHDGTLPGDAEDAGAHDVTVAGIRAVLAGASPRQLHETWVQARKMQGWVYGPRKDSRRKTHPCLVPYDDLPEYQRVKDAVFAAIVRAMSRSYGGAAEREATGNEGGSCENS